MQKKQLHLKLSKDTFDIIDKIKEEKSLKYYNEVIEFIVNELIKLQSQKEIIKQALKERDDELSSSYERNRWALRTAERNSIYILDILNTLLSTQKFGEFKGGLIPVDFSKHKLVLQSEEQLKSKIEHFKQEKDNRIL